MNTELPESAIVYLAEGKVRVKAGSAPPRTVESPYGNSIREKSVRAQQKHSWKAAANDGSPFSGPALWGKAGQSQDVPLTITSICAGREKAGVIYSLESGTLCALLETSQFDQEEKRLWNDNRTRLRHLAVSSATGDLVCAILHENGTANIGLKLNGESGVKELTEGDSFDTAPRWMPGEGRKVIFQSAGVGRNREGQFSALGPFCIQQLDVVSSEMTTLMEDARYDYLAPQCLEDGRLFYIRRPYVLVERFNFFRTLKDFLLFPFRLLFAVFQFLNFFSTIFTGRPLSSSGGAKARQMQMRQMMIWGNLVQGQRQKSPAEEGIDLVPKSWELYQRTAEGDTKLVASGVLAYDVRQDGTIVYTNGSALFLLDRTGRVERVLNEAMIEQVFFVPC